MPIDEVPPAVDTKIAFTGDNATAEVVVTMLTARGIASELVGDHQIEGGTLVAAVRVPADQLEDALALVADFTSGAASR
jgi:hypothetical protein